MGDYPLEPILCRNVWEIRCAGFHINRFCVVKNIGGEAWTKEP